MKVLIRTLPLTSANYGGILQNWALQQTLRDLGTEPVTDLSERQPPSPATTKRVLKNAAIRVRGLLPAHWNLIKGDRRRFADAPVLRFVDDEVATTNLFRPFSSTPRRDLLSEMDAFIAGSDQVWRKDYADVPSFLFDFLPVKDHRPRVAYAASLGALDANSWSCVELRQMARLLRRFDATSVREQEAVKWCIENLGTAPELMPDPTLLLKMEQYDKLISENSQTSLTSERDRPYLLLYLLDADPRVSNQARDLAERRNLKVIETGQCAPSSGRQRPSVTDWLCMVRDAQAVVTDSFHGMVFSTIFHKAFAVMPNEKRGLDRFSSFTSIHGLEDRLAPDCQSLGASLAAETDWSHVQHALSEDRTRGVSFLKSTLGSQHDNSA